MQRPDLSNYLAHFTSSRWPKAHKDANNPTNDYKFKSALDRLKNILATRKILASQLPWVGNHKAVCLTECPWSGLLGHTKQYSCYGLGFTKDFVFSKGGGPVFYVRADMFNAQHWENDFLPFVTPIWPEYAPLKRDFNNGKPLDFSHEREWRTPNDLEFEYSDIAFVVLPNYAEMAKFPQNFKDAIGREKFILMDNYKQIETFWPVHNI